jgi:hypothetical protein
MITHTRSAGKVHFSGTWKQGIEQYERHPPLPDSRCPA